jgi:multicomponent Na+:H+ antiporter subunit B
MTRRQRLAIFAVGALGMAGLLGWGISGLPAFGHYQGGYGNLLNREAVPERHGTNVVTDIVFDYRGFDTLGEEFILFSAVVGVTLLLRGRSEEENEEKLLREAPDDRTRSDAVQVFGLVALPAVFLLGLWIVAFGVVTPGGGFQGGVILAGAMLLVFLAGGFRPYKELTPTAFVDLAEGTGAAAYTLVGVGGLLAGAAYLHNFIGLGAPGTLKAGGTMLLLDWATAIEVSSAMLLLFSLFLQRYVVPRMEAPA